MAYTYLLKFKLTGQVYYGVRYAQNCNPKELWVTYFTSSNLIHALIKAHGKDSFDFTIRKVFNNNKQAVLWESKVLKKFNAATNPMWLNKSNGDSKFRACSEFTQKHREKISEALTGRTIPLEVKKKLKGRPSPKFWKGEKLSQDHRRKISEGQKGRLGYWKGKKLPAEMKKKMSEARRSPLSEEAKLKLRKPKSLEHRKKLSERQDLKLIGICPHCLKEGQALALKRWHFENCKAFNEK